MFIAEFWKKIKKRKEKKSPGIRTWFPCPYNHIAHRPNRFFGFLYVWTKLQFISTLGSNSDSNIGKKISNSKHFSSTLKPSSPLLKCSISSSTSIIY